MTGTQAYILCKGLIKKSQKNPCECNIGDLTLSDDSIYISRKDGSKIGEGVDLKNLGQGISDATKDGLAGIITDNDNPYDKGYGMIGDDD